MGKKKKKKEEPSGPAGAPDWVVTFTDMISLLVTFFILLLTFSSMESYKKLKVDSFLEGNRGIHKPGGITSMDLGAEDVIAASSNLRGGNRPHTRPGEELTESIKEMGESTSAAHRGMDMNDVADGILIKFNASESFAPGSTKLSAALQKSLGELARVLQHYPHQVVVEGFTDGAFRPTSIYSNADELSLARANKAAQYMLENSRLSPQMVQLTGLGERSAVADNVTAKGRQLNRRIRIRVLSMDSYRASSLRSTGQTNGSRK